MEGWEGDVCDCWSGCIRIVDYSMNGELRGTPWLIPHNE